MTEGFDSLLQGGKNRRRILVFAHQHDACDDFVLFVFAYNSLARHGTVADCGDIVDEQRRAVTLSHQDIADVVAGTEQTDAANQVLLFALFEETPAGIGVRPRERREDLLQRDVVSFEFVEIEVHLVLLDKSPPADHIRDPGHRLQLTLDHPVLGRAQVGRGVVVALEYVPVDLADRGRERANLGLDADGELDSLEPLQDLLAREVVIDGIIEGDVNEGQAELSMGKEPDRMRKAAESDLERDRHLLFHFFRGVAGEKGDYRNLNVRHVRKRLDRKLLECGDSPRYEEPGRQEQKERLVQGKGYDFREHC